MVSQSYEILRELLDGPTETLPHHRPQLYHEQIDAEGGRGGGGGGGIRFDVISVGQPSSSRPCNSVGAEMKFCLDCKFRFPCAPLYVVKNALKSISVSIEA